jgi:glycosyltransferase involved in cell wall biosynthesis
MRTLHVAALPFPSAQGTQAAVHAMLCALQDDGQRPELLCYAHGVRAIAAPYVIHRPQLSLGVRSLRSGPSLPKLALDVVLARALRKLHGRGQFDWVVAHHVEAAAACLLAGVPRFAFVAHTSLREELPFYFPAKFARSLRRAGDSLDRFLCRRAARAFAVAPALAYELSARSGLAVHGLHLPWPVPPAVQPDERARARRELGFGPGDELVLYAGNLDPYQGLAVLAESLALLSHQRPRLKFLLATQATPAGLASCPLARRVARCVALASEADRRRAHAAADLVVVPRASSAGLPVKLLDALARGVPAVAAHKAAGGLLLDAVCTLVDGDDPRAFAAAIASELTAPDPGRAVRARAFVARAHGKVPFLEEFARGLRAGGEPERAPARSASEPFLSGDKVT